MNLIKIPKIIAEVGMSHNGNITLAHSYIDAASKAGADAIKFQTHYADEESSIFDKFRTKNKYINYKTRFDYWKNTEFTSFQWQELKNHADKKNIIFFSSPFSFKAVEVLSSIGVKIWKIASGEVSNLPLIEKISKLKQNVIVSTGMSNYKEIDQAINVIKKYHNKFAIAQCTSLYPCPPDKIGLNLIKELKKKYKCSVGFSDHSGNHLTPFLAKIIGADFVEMHVVFDKDFIGFDTESSITFKQISEIASNINFSEKLLNGKINKDNIPKEIKKNKYLFEKSIFTKKKIEQGKKIKIEDITFKKPLKGLKAKDYKKVLGKKLKRTIDAGFSIKLKDIS